MLHVSQNIKNIVIKWVVNNILFPPWHFQEQMHSKICRLIQSFGIYSFNWKNETFENRSLKHLNVTYSVTFEKSLQWHQEIPTLSSELHSQIGVMDEVLKGSFVFFSSECLLFLCRESWFARGVLFRLVPQNVPAVRPSGGPGHAAAWVIAVDLGYSELGQLYEKINIQALIFFMKCLIKDSLYSVMWYKYLNGNK